MNNIWMKFGCLLTGWNSKTLAQCSEASRIQLSKYTSALVILMIIWGGVGFSFAHRYMELPVLGCALVSVVCVTLIVMIERQILLSIHPTRKLAAFRTVIAVIMAVIGSTIFDQTMFGKDINKHMSDIIEQQTATLSVQRMGDMKKKQEQLQKEKNSLDNENSVLQADINAHPWIVQTSSTNTQETIVVNGKTRKVNTPSVTRNQVPNPKQSVVDANNEKLKLISRQMAEQDDKILSVEETTREECAANVGFLEELEAMVSIITTRWVAGAFYIVFFLLLMSLELFVVTSKMGDGKCDYEMVLESSQRVREEQLRAVFAGVRNRQ